MLTARIASDELILLSHASSLTRWASLSGSYATPHGPQWLTVRRRWSQAEEAHNWWTPSRSKSVFESASTSAIQVSGGMNCVFLGLREDFDEPVRGLSPKVGSNY